MPIDAPMTLADAQQLYQKPAHVAPAVAAEPGNAELAALLKSGRIDASGARARAIIDSGLSVGLKAGMGAQLRVIGGSVERSERDLDTVYDFGRLMIQGRVVPPVITEARDLYNQDGEYTIRLSGALFKIETQARFSSVPPNWRDYLSFALTPTTVDAVSMVTGVSPKTGDEERLWKAAVTDGWNQGVGQANLMFKHAMDRMNRDLLGMYRFQTFVVQGKISMPAVASESIPVTRAGQSMAVDETLLRITTLPEFDNVADHWSGSIVTSPNQILPDGALSPDQSDMAPASQPTANPRP